MAVFFYFILVSVAFFMAFTMGIYANPHKNIILENTLPEDKLQDPSVQAIRKRYKKRLVQLAAVFSVLSLPLLFIPYDSILLFLFLLLLFSFIGSGYYLQIVYIRKMAALKMQNGWLLPKRPLLIDTQLVLNKNQKLISCNYSYFCWGLLFLANGDWFLDSFLNYCFDVKFVHWRLLFYCALTCQTAN